MTLAMRIVIQKVCPTGLFGVQSSRKTPHYNIQNKFNIHQRTYISNYNTVEENKLENRDQ